MDEIAGIAYINPLRTTYSFIKLSLSPSIYNFISLFSHLNSLFGYFKGK